MEWNGMVRKCRKVQKQKEKKMKKDVSQNGHFLGQSQSTCTNGSGQIRPPSKTGGDQRPVAVPLS